MNVILLVIDALRVDHISYHGYSRNTTPHIDEFAKEGASFLNTYATLPRSDSSMGSMLTGMYPHSNGIRTVWNNKLRSDIQTLPQILKSHGYTTAFVRSGSWPRDGTHLGFDGYDEWSWKIKNRIKREIWKFKNKGKFQGIAEQKFGTAKEWISKNKDKNFFLMLHTNDLHWPYPVPEPFEHMYDPDYKGNHDFATMKNGEIKRSELIFGLKKLPQEEIDHAKAHYDGGITYVDQEIGKFFSFLKDNGLYDNSVIIVTADHGEHFGEHGYYFQHGASLYEQSLKTPLIIRCPKKVTPEKKVETRVQCLDIFPTVLDALDIPLVDAVEGESLLPVIEGKPLKREYVFAESVEEHFKGNAKVFMKGIPGKWRTMIKGNYKIIYIPHPTDPLFELFDLSTDPEEQNNLAEKEKKKFEEMKTAILDFVSKQENEGGPSEEDLTEKSRKLLVKAGYLDEE